MIIVVPYREAALRTIVPSRTTLTSRENREHPRRKREPMSCAETRSGAQNDSGIPISSSTQGRRPPLGTRYGNHNASG